ncbi:MAG: hypothetical protein J0H80_17305 [Rhizobiales bacterium]|nr:hypothetical protein [Hyphomicrobiales bacterium]
MIKIDPQRINVLRRIADSRRLNAEALAQAASDEMHKVDALRKEILKTTRRHERDGGMASELTQLRSRQQAAQSSHADACERMEIAQENARVARKLLTRCEDFLKAPAGDRHDV